VRDRSGNGSARYEPREDAFHQPRLGVVFVQHDRAKHRRGLPTLLGGLSRLSAESTVVVTDNLHPGDWTHTVTADLHHIGGDNEGWEFSAFDRGIDWLRRDGDEPDLYVLATDALLAYGREFLELVDDLVIDCTRRHSVCVGWIDSFMQRCEVLGYSYDAWLRSSLLLVPRTVLAKLRPLVAPLDDTLLFGESPLAPFRPDAPISANLQRLLLDWLTTNGRARTGLERAWHSRFPLAEETFELFKSKVKAILREHLLSARLRALGYGCYDLRAIHRARDLGLLDVAMPGTRALEWQWLAWRHDAGERELEASG